MRSSACGASLVWSVANTRWPVSARLNAIWIESRSRISPRSTTSGSSRRALRRPAVNDSTSVPTSRWLTIARLWWWRYSTGSSMVRMCTGLVSLMRSIIAANVVDLPEPVGPTDEHDAVRPVQQRVARRRCAELLERAHAERHDAQCQRQRAALVERVGTEATEPGDAEREVDLLVRFELGALVLVEQRVHHRLDVGVLEHLDVLERHQRAVAARRCRTANREVEVGRTGVDGRLEQASPGSRRAEWTWG